MNDRPNVAIVAALAWIITVGMGSVTALIIMGKEYEVISGAVVVPSVSGLLIYAGIKLAGGRGNGGPPTA